MSSDLKKIACFGNEWNKAGASRVYFNNLAELFGLKVVTDEQQKIVSATVDGEPITLKQAVVLISKLYRGKLWFDFEKNTFNYLCLDPVIANCIIDEIRRKINGDAYCG